MWDRQKRQRRGSLPNISDRHRRDRCGYWSVSQRNLSEAWPRHRNSLSIGRRASEVQLSSSLHTEWGSVVHNDHDMRVTTAYRHIQAENAFDLNYNMLIGRRRERRRQKRMRSEVGGISVPVQFWSFWRDTEKYLLRDGGKWCGWTLKRYSKNQKCWYIAAWMTRGEAIRSFTLVKAMLPNKSPWMDPNQHWKWTTP